MTGIKKTTPPEMEDWLQEQGLPYRKDDIELMTLTLNYPFEEFKDNDERRKRALELWKKYGVVFTSDYDLFGCGACDLMIDQEVYGCGNLCCNAICGLTGESVTQHCVPNGGCNLATKCLYIPVSD